MSDEKFDAFLQREAQRYNEPPENTPRDEMFAAIRAARGAGRKPEAGGRTPYAVWLGMAATLVIGVAIGKYVLQNENAPRAIARTAASVDTAGTSYAAATAAQFVRAEALLTAYGASGTNTGVDKQLSSWARDILENTRLLLDSPAGDSPTRKRLLQDLELVLVQLVQRSPSVGAAEERSHIERSIERTHVLPRLRSALPAGRNSGI